MQCGSFKCEFFSHKAVLLDKATCVRICFPLNFVFATVRGRWSHSRDDQRLENAGGAFGNKTTKAEVDSEIAALSSFPSFLYVNHYFDAGLPRMSRTDSVVPCYEGP